MKARVLVVGAGATWVLCVAAVPVAWAWVRTQSVHHAYFETVPASVPDDWRSYPTIAQAPQRKQASGPPSDPIGVERRTVPLGDFELSYAHEVRAGECSGWFGGGSACMMDSMPNTTVSDVRVRGATDAEAGRMNVDACETKQTFEAACTQRFDDAYLLRQPGTELYVVAARDFGSRDTPVFAFRHVPRRARVPAGPASVLAALLASSLLLARAARRAGARTRLATGLVRGGVLESDEAPVAVRGSIADGPVLFDPRDVTSDGAPPYKASAAIDARRLTPRTVLEEKARFATLVWALCAVTLFSAFAAALTVRAMLAP